MPYFSGLNLGFLFAFMSAVKSFTILIAFGERLNKQIMFIQPRRPIPMSAVLQINEESTIALTTSDTKNTHFAIKIAGLLVLPIMNLRLFSMM